ncbi:MAG TPA: class IV adenylate cyclase [Acidobacteriaceae bacterium]|jgi:adenylate cyclase class 2|nr:class IV adenylate cyclase [Acidobacteriaceae bacterium]
MAVEIELKFTVDDLPALEVKLRALGFRLDTPRTFESNTLYDTPERTLRARKQILRIRQYGETWTLTHKAAPPNTDDSLYKTRIETETAIADGEALAQVFVTLGYQPVFRYEKFRSEWSDPATGHHLVLDETPIGIYAELEGDPAWIDAMLAALEVPAGHRTTESYGKLFLNWKELTQSPAENLTFDAIK